MAFYLTGFLPESNSGAWQVMAQGFAVVDDVFARARIKAIELLKVAKQIREQSPFDERVAKLSDAQLALRHAAVEIVVLEMRLENARASDGPASEQIQAVVERMRNGRYSDIDVG